VKRRRRRRRRRKRRRRNKTSLFDEVSFPTGTIMEMN
jgi:hypothetical protein